MVKTKAQIADEVRAEHLAKAAGTPDAELKVWSTSVFEELKAAQIAFETAKNDFKMKDTAHKEARLMYKRQQSSNRNHSAASAWRATIIAAEDASNALKKARETKNRLHALSELLGSLLQQRRRTSPSNLVPQVCTAVSKKQPTPIESCPFCTHVYTVRDGTSGVDAEGNEMHYRRCQCRVMAPPCRRCPVCKSDPTIMASDESEQLRMCREDINCEICACECPGAGKWVEGDEESRNKFKERAAKRHAELSALLQSSWSDGGQISGSFIEQSAGTVAGRGHQTTQSDKILTSRLPADIKDQLEAAAAAESLHKFSTFDHHAYDDGVDGGTQCGGRKCCGEILATVPPKRQRTTLVNNNRRNDTATATTTNSDDNNDDTSRHRHDHMHRCQHSHDECTSSCCSAISHT